MGCDRVSRREGVAPIPTALPLDSGHLSVRSDDARLAPSGGTDRSQSRCGRRSCRPRQAGPGRLPAWSGPALPKSRRLRGPRRRARRRQGGEAGGLPGHRRALFAFTRRASGSGLACTVNRPDRRPDRPIRNTPNSPLATGSIRSKGNWARSRCSRTTSSDSPCAC